MPILLKYTPNQQIQQSAPALTDPALARSAGEDIANIGGAVSDVSHKIAQYEEAKTHTLQQLQVNKAHSNAKDTAESLANDVYVNGSADGQDWDQKFSQKFDKASRAMLKGIKDPVALAEAQNKIDEVRVDYRAKILSSSREALKDFAKTSVNESKNASASRISVDPYKYDSEIKSYGDLINNSVMSAQAKTENLQTAKKEFATSAINAFMSAGSFNAAKEQLQTKFAGVFDPKEQQTKLAAIQTEKERYLKTAAMDESNGERVVQDLQEKVYSKTFSDRLKSAKQVVQGGLDAKAVTGFEAALHADELNGKIKPDTAQILRQVVSGNDGDTHAPTAAVFYSKLSEHKNLPALKNEVVQAAASSTISASTATDILEKIDLFQKQGELRAKDGKVQSDPRFTAALKRIDQMTPKALVDTGDPDQMIGARKKSEWDDLELRAKTMLANKMAGQYGRDPTKALNEVLKSVYGRETAPVPAVQPLADPKAKHPLSANMHKFQSGKLDKKAYAQSLIDYVQAKPNETKIKARKDGGK